MVSKGEAHETQRRRALLASVCEPAALLRPRAEAVSHLDMFDVELEERQHCQIMGVDRQSRPTCRYNGAVHEVLDQLERRHHHVVVRRVQPAQVSAVQHVLELYGVGEPVYGGEFEPEEFL